MSTDKFSGGLSVSSSGVPSSSNKASNVDSQLKTKPLELGHSATAHIDSVLVAAAASLHDRPERLPGGERVARVAHDAADKITSTAEYIRGHHVDAMVEDVKALIKNHPGPALLVAAAIGLLLGKAFSSTD